MSHSWQPWLYAVHKRVCNILNDDKTSIPVIAGCGLVLMAQFR
jgi:hypothetical protein